MERQFRSLGTGIVMHLGVPQVSVAADNVEKIFQLLLRVKKELFFRVEECLHIMLLG